MNRSRIRLLEKLKACRTDKKMKGSQQLIEMESMMVKLRSDAHVCILKYLSQSAMAITRRRKELHSAFLMKATAVRILADQAWMSRLDKAAVDILTQGINSLSNDLEQCHGNQDLAWSEELKDMEEHLLSCQKQGLLAYQGSAGLRHAEYVAEQQAFEKSDGSG